MFSEVGWRHEVNDVVIYLLPTNIAMCAHTPRLTGCCLFAGVVARVHANTLPMLKVSDHPMNEILIQNTKLKPGGLWAITTVTFKLGRSVVSLRPPEHCKTRA